MVSRSAISRRIESRADVSEAERARAVRKYGRVAYADPVNKKYPLDEEHIRAAISYWGMPKNRAKYSREEQVAITKRILAAARRFGVEAKSLEKLLGELRS